MAELVNGHVTISIGLNGNGARRAGGSTARLSENERLSRAQRLRRDGYSYRRIAAVMGLSY
ncbi:MAG TPA: hypothetical protein VLL76_06465, partial [Candidatus Omnitrophota bacterium]|nr:hypothetical protein [Candidatus Omnitrophota bacterium]